MSSKLETLTVVKGLEGGRGKDAKVETLTTTESGKY